MTDFHIRPDNRHETERRELGSEVFGHPDDVLTDPHLSIQDKRALLASWASDANAVPHLPTLRQLPDGSIVKLDEILRALKALDAPLETAPARAGQGIWWQQPFDRRQRWALRRRTRYGRKPDSDDDPPPCPAHAALRPRGGGGAAACAELAEA